MPYIEKERQEYIKTFVPIDLGILTEGELNFYLTTIAAKWLEGRGLSYTNINQVIGVLECAKQELYRRVAAPYENQKVQTNGDVFPPSLLST